MIHIERVPPKVVWPLRHVVMYPNKDFDSIKLPQDEMGVHLALYEGDRAISVISLFIENNALQFRKFATLQEEQGKGYGTRLLQHVIALAREQALSRTWCHARQSAAPFYRKFGFRETGEAFSKGGIDYVIMELALYYNV